MRRKIEQAEKAENECPGGHMGAAGLGSPAAVVLWGWHLTKSALRIWMAERLGPFSSCDNGCDTKSPPGSAWGSFYFLKSISEIHFRNLFLNQNPIQIRKCISESDLDGLEPPDVPPAKCGIKPKASNAPLAWPLV